METDEDLARRLQKEFDEEAQLAEERDRRDAQLAQKLASGAHDLSDSEEEEERSKSERIEISESEEEDEKEQNRGETEVNRSKRKSDYAIRGTDDHEDSDTSLREEEEEEEVLYAGPDQKEEESKQGTEDQDEDQGQENEAPQHTHTATAKRPMCKYGRKCYRKNPAHLREFAHPPLAGRSIGGGAEEGTEGAEGVKRKGKEERLGESEEKEEKRRNKIRRKEFGSASNGGRDPFSVRLSCSEPFRCFLNKCFSLEATQDDPLGLVFPDLLDPALGTLQESAQLNFMVDLDFLMSQYKAFQLHHKPLLVAYGQMEGDASLYPALTCEKVRLPIPYGVHHTKAMLLLYQEGLRVVVHTANLVPGDWYEKTQGYWVSPVFPPLDKDKPRVLDGESPTGFKRDLVEYLQFYKSPKLTSWASVVKRHDFTTCNAVLVGSVPGYHQGPQRDTWGHIKLRRILARHSAPPAPPRGQHPTTIIQCSSIGSLGKDSRSWLTSELGLSLAGHRDTGSALPASLPKVCVVYPSQDDVRNSSEGWLGGSCLPYSSATHQRQPWLQQHLHLWHSANRCRTRAMPHIKTYTRVSSDLQHAHYLMLTSANLSKAAWGCLQKDGTQLFIRSYELGVLLLPKFVTGEAQFSLPPSASPCLPLPYDLPLTPYPPGATPWFSDTKKEGNDILGRSYP